LRPASRRQIHAVTTPDLQRVPAVKATLDALSEAALRGHGPSVPWPRPVMAVGPAGGGTDWIATD
ncbi:MAG TPA: hypothetical protein VHM65_00910, partial [Candidatus Lustribacter sp.]|nr:hypothetical protein [Candidatus Lustribacter sp.]